MTSAVSSVERGRLREVRHLLLIVEGQIGHVAGVLYQLDPFGRLAHCSDHLLVLGVTHQDDLIVLRHEAPGLVVDVRHQGTRRVDDVQIRSVRRGRPDRRRDAVGRQHDGGTVGHLIEFGDEKGALGLQLRHDMHVVNDLSAYVDRAAKSRQRPFDYFDRPFDAGAERPGTGQHHVVRTTGPSPSLERQTHRSQQVEISRRCARRIVPLAVDDGPHYRKGVVR
jgi:hypothetical protein